MLFVTWLAVPACSSMADLHKGLDKDVESAYGEPHPSRDVVRNARRVIVKVSHLSRVGEHLTCFHTCCIEMYSRAINPPQFTTFKSHRTAPTNLSLRIHMQAIQPNTQS